MPRECGTVCSEIEVQLQAWVPGYLCLEITMKKNLPDPIACLAYKAVSKDASRRQRSVTVYTVYVLPIIIVKAIIFYKTGLGSNRGKRCLYCVLKLLIFVLSYLASCTNKPELMDPHPGAPLLLLAMDAHDYHQPVKNLGRRVAKHHSPGQR